MRCARGSLGRTSDGCAHRDPCERSPVASLGRSAPRPVACGRRFRSRSTGSPERSAEAQRIAEGSRARLLESESSRRRFASSFVAGQWEGCNGRTRARACFCGLCDSARRPVSLPRRIAAGSHFARPGCGAAMWELRPRPPDGLAHHTFLVRRAAIDLFAERRHFGVPFSTEGPTDTIRA